MDRGTIQGRSNDGVGRAASAIRHPDLRDACQEFLVDALQVLDPRSPTPAEASENGERAALYNWTAANREQLIALPSATRAALAVARAGLNIGKVTDKDGKERTSEEYAPWHVFDIVLGPLVVEYVAANRGRVSFSPRAFRTVYLRLEEGYSVGPPLRFVAPLENFETEQPRVRVETGLWIEPLTQADIEHLAFFFPHTWPRWPGLPTGRPRCGMVMVHRSHRLAPFSGYNAKFRALQLALRLTRPELVGYRFVVQYAPRPAFEQALSEGASWSMRPPLGYGPRYVLGCRDEARVRSVFRALADETVLRAYPIAFSRFDDAYWRDKLEDAVIDVWIALESLFMPDADPREATFRLALRIAYFLGRTPEERVAIDKDIRDSYNLRSAVVHGRLYSQSDLKALSDKTTNYLRQALRALVEKPGEVDVDRIDRAVRAGKDPTKIQ